MEPADAQISHQSHYLKITFRIGTHPEQGKAQELSIKRDTELLATQSGWQTFTFSQSCFKNEPYLTYCGVVILNGGVVA
jgi:hypothetical protein